jgi:anti-sigma factor RsiW
MKCEEVSKKLISYLDARTNPVERRRVEDHLAGCAACRTRAEEFRNLWSVLDEMPAVDPSFGFDARVRQRVAAEPRRQWFEWFVPQPRLALSVAMLIALTVWVVKVPSSNPSNPVAVAAAQQQEDFNAIKDLGVLENYDVLTKFDALSELPVNSTPEADKTQRSGQTAND